MGKLSGKTNLSVVMAVYKNDRVEWFEQAIDSILSQTASSNDIIIVRDGEVPAKLESILARYEKKFKEVTIMRLEQNIGAGEARNRGVAVAKNELVAIMDADDISLTDRFALQLTAFADDAELALVGGQLSEFEGDPKNITGYRKVPTEYADIKKFARRRSPINHVTVMFKKQAFMNVGGYLDMSRAEDYYMVSALIAKGYRIQNIDNTIVNCRTSSDNIQRRKSWRNVRENIVSRWQIRKLGTMSFVDFCVSSAAQVLLFVMPTRLVSVMFDTLLRSSRG